MDLRDIKEFIKDTLGIVIIITCAFIIFAYIIGMQQIVGPSMNNTFQNEDYVIIFKANYKFFPVKRFDIISFYYDETKYLIKRVIGLPGDTVEIKNNILYINGEQIEEEYVNSNTEDFSLSDLGYSTIPENMYLVLGDNRADSLDSREFGLIKKDDIVGKVLFKIWPLN